MSLHSIRTILVVWIDEVVSPESGILDIITDITNFKPTICLNLMYSKT